MSIEKPPFERLVEEHGAFIRRTLAQLGVTTRDLPDVEQEVFRGINRGLPGFDPALSVNPETAVRGWLFGICERQAANHRRSTLKRGEILFATEELDHATNAVPSVEEQLIDHERHALLMQLLAAVEPNRRAVVIAYELEGIPMAEIAAGLSIPVNTAWNRLRLGREDLRAAWKRLARKQTRTAPLPSLALLFGTASWTAMDGTGTGAAASASSAGAHAAAGASVPVVVSAGATVATVGAFLTAMFLSPGDKPPSSVPAYSTPAAITATVTVTATDTNTTSDTNTGTDTPPVAPTEPAKPTDLASPDPLLVLPASTSSSAPAEQPPSVTPTLARAPVRADKPAPRSSASAAASAGPGRLQPELSHIQEATAAIERGDARAAEKALSDHERSFADGRLAGEREVLSIQLLLYNGRRNEARDRVRAFLSAHPESPFRSRLEALVQPPAAK